MLSPKGLSPYSPARTRSLGLLRSPRKRLARWFCLTEWRGPLPPPVLGWPSIPFFVVAHDKSYDVLGENLYEKMRKSRARICNPPTSFVARANSDPHLSFACQV